MCYPWVLMKALKPGELVTSRDENKNPDFMAFIS